MQEPDNDGDRLRAAFHEWFEHERNDSPGKDIYRSRNRLAVGLIVLEIARSHYPLQHDQYATPGNQVIGMNQRSIQAIMAQHGETRRFLAEAGRTVRGAVAAAGRLATRLNESDVFQSYSDANRGMAIDAWQRWIVERITEYFERQRLTFEPDLSSPAARIIQALIAAGEDRKAGGVIAQHLVGAKLALRYPHLDIPCHSATTADQQLSRPGDFFISDTAFHVTVAPAEEVIERCRDNVMNGFRVVLLVPEHRLVGTRQWIELAELDRRVSVSGIETFVGQNLDEIAEFGAAELRQTLRQLLLEYNRRIDAAESDRSLMFELPANL